MITFEVHPAYEQFHAPAFSTCCECHRSFHAKNEDQLSVSLCDHCFEVARHASKPIVSVLVRVLPHRRIGL
jgi:hypothetical protein